MRILEVPGARRCCGTHGSGPLSGVPRSQLNGPQDYDQRPETDADAARRLLTEEL
jgi:hypothetical protein